MSLNDIFGPHPGRPDHPDFAKLSSIVLQLDGKTEDADFDFEAHLATVVDPESILYMVQQRTMILCHRLGMEPLTFLQTIGMGVAVDAFMVGVEWGKQMAAADEER